MGDKEKKLFLFIYCDTNENRHEIKYRIFCLLDLISQVPPPMQAILLLLAQCASGQIKKKSVTFCNFFSHLMAHRSK